MKTAAEEAASKQAEIRAMAVGAGLMTEQEAEKWIVVRAGEWGVGRFEGIEPPTVCEGCGKEHDHDEWTPMEIGISREMPDAARQSLVFLLQQVSGPVN